MASASAAGIVRAARRPPGWRAPGPPPSGGAGPGRDEDLCYLAGDWRIFQRVDGHRWSLDDLVTAWLAADTMQGTPPARIADLGAGIGAVLMLLAWRFPAAHLVGVEAQPLSVDLARRSLAWNGIADRCTVRLGDLRDDAVLPEGSAFDLVTGTPPYLRPGAATPARRVQCAAAHIAYRGGIDAYCRAAARVLAPGGRFVACAAAAQAAEVTRAADAHGLTITRWRAVVPRAGKPALFAVFAMARAATRARDPERPLIVRDGTGARTAEFRTLRDMMGMPP